MNYAPNVNTNYIIFPAVSIRKYAVVQVDK